MAWMQGFVPLFAFLCLILTSAKANRNYFTITAGSDGITVPTGPRNQTGTGAYSPLSIVAWVWLPSAISGDFYLFSQGEASSEGWAVSLKATAPYTMCLRKSSQGTGNSCEVELPTIPRDQWVHVSFTYQGTTQPLGRATMSWWTPVNGTVSATDHLDAQVPSSGAPVSNITIGRAMTALGTAQAFHISRFMYFRRQISSLEIDAARRGEILDPTGLTHYYPFNEQAAPVTGFYGPPFNPVPGAVTYGVPWTCGDGVVQPHEGCDSNSPGCLDCMCHFPAISTGAADCYVMPKRAPVGNTYFTLSPTTPLILNDRPSTRLFLDETVDKNPTWRTFSIGGWFRLTPTAQPSYTIWKTNSADAYGDNGVMLRVLANNTVYLTQYADNQIVADSFTGFTMTGNLWYYFLVEVSGKVASFKVWTSFADMTATTHSQTNFATLNLAKFPQLVNGTDYFALSSNTNGFNGGAANVMITTDTLFKPLGYVWGSRKVAEAAWGTVPVPALTQLFLVAGSQPNQITNLVTGATFSVTTQKGSSCGFPYALDPLEQCNSFNDPYCQNCTCVPPSLPNGAAYCYVPDHVQSNQANNFKWGNAGSHQLYEDTLSAGLGFYRTISVCAWVALDGGTTGGLSSGLDANPSGFSWIYGTSQGVEVSLKNSLAGSTPVTYVGSTIGLSMTHTCIVIRYQNNSVYNVTTFSNGKQNDTKLITMPNSVVLPSSPFSLSGTQSYIARFVLWRGVGLAESDLPGVMRGVYPYPEQIAVDLPFNEPSDEHTERSTGASFTSQKLFSRIWTCGNGQIDPWEQCDLASPVDTGCTSCSCGAMGMIDFSGTKPICNARPQIAIFEERYFLPLDSYLDLSGDYFGLTRNATTLNVTSPSFLKGPPSIVGNATMMRLSWTYGEPTFALGPLEITITREYGLSTTRIIGTVVNTTAVLYAIGGPIRRHVGSASPNEISIVGMGFGNSQANSTYAFYNQPTDTVPSYPADAFYVSSWSDNFFQIIKNDSQAWLPSNLWIRVGRLGVITPPVYCGTVYGDPVVNPISAISALTTTLTITGGDFVSQSAWNNGGLITFTKSFLFSKKRADVFTCPSTITPTAITLSVACFADPTEYVISGNFFGVTVRLGNVTKYATPSISGHIPKLASTAQTYSFDVAPYNFAYAYYFGGVAVPVLVESQGHITLDLSGVTLSQGSNFSLAMALRSGDTFQTTPQTLSEIVPPPVITQNLNQVLNATNGGVLSITVSDFDFVVQNNIVSLTIIDESNPTLTSSGYCIVNLGAGYIANTIECTATIPTIPSFSQLIIQATVTSHGAASDPQTIGSLLLPPVVVPIGTIAASATNLTLTGSRFNPSPLINFLLFYGDPTPSAYNSLTYMNALSLSGKVNFNVTTATYVDANTYYCDLPSGLIQSYERNTSFAGGAFASLFVSVQAGLTSEWILLAVVVPAPAVAPPSSPVTLSSNADTVTLTVSHLGDTFDVEFSVTEGTAPTCGSPTPITSTTISCTLVWPPTKPTGTLSATVFTNGAASPSIEIATIYPAPTITVRTGRRFAISSRRFVFPAAGLPVPADVQISFYVDGQTGAAVGCEYSTDSTATSLICDTGANLKGTGVVYAMIKIYGGNVEVSTAKRAAPSADYFVVGTSVPAPVVTASSLAIGLSDVTFTITGTNFGDTNADNQIEITFRSSPVTAMLVSSSATALVVQLGASAWTSAGDVAASVSSYGSAFTSPLLVAVVTDATTPEPSSAIEGDPSVGIGVGAGVGGAAAIAIAIVVIFLVRRMRKQKAHRKFNLEGDGAEMTSLTKTDYQNYEAEKAKHDLDKWAIPYGDIVFGKQIGKGSYGVVYAGEWRDNKVAIKEALITDEVQRNEFFAEAKLMLNLRPHHNVVQIFGICVHEGFKCYIVMEYMQGSLDKIIFREENRKKLTQKDFLRYAIGIAKGLNHIAKEGIVHRDIACRNILIGKDGKPKISDFGMSRQLRDTGEGQTKTAVGPIAWMSPEMINSRLYSEKSDVWMYGCLLSEIVSGQMPHRDCVDKLELALKIRDEGLHPAIPADSPEVLKKVMNSCFQYEPSQRPKFSDIIKLLRGEKEGKKESSEEDEEIAPPVYGNHDQASQQSDQSDQQDEAPPKVYGNPPDQSSQQFDQQSEQSDQ